MATYATEQDYENYVGGSGLNVSVVEALLRKAERDMDTILIPVQSPTDEIQGITLAPDASSGGFQLQFVWNRLVYTSDVIAWNATSAQVIAALLAATDPHGVPAPPGVWMLPINSFYMHPWAAGPLPGAAVVVQATNSLGGQPIEAMAVVNNTVVGTTPTVSISEIVRGGLKLNPYLLSGEDSYILTQATCAQAEYRNEMGENFFVRAQWQSVSGPEFKTQGRLPRIGPKVKAELTGSDLLQRGARARPGTVKGMATAYMPVGGTPIPDDWRSI